MVFKGSYYPGRNQPRLRIDAKRITAEVTFSV
jgi:hypothetical protein